MKKENLIVIFYCLYFLWLFTVVFLTENLNILNIFTSVVALFYFVFLRTPRDLLFFWGGALILIIITLLSYNASYSRIDIFFLKYVPVWLPIAWGTTVVALRRLYQLIVR